MDAYSVVMKVVWTDTSKVDELDSDLESFAVG